MIREVNTNDWPALHEAWNAAFLDYPINSQLTFEQFMGRFQHRTRLQLGQSAVAIENEKIVAFWLTSSGQYLGKPFAYNAGTGALPHYRGGRSKALFQFLLPSLVEQNLAAVSLEVLCDNKSAIKAYQSGGFKITDQLHCFKLGAFRQVKSITNQALRFEVVKNPSPNALAVLPSTLLPTFQDRDEEIKKVNESNTRVNNFNLLIKCVEHHTTDAIKNQEGKAVGFLLARPQGRIVRLVVDPNYRSQGIGSQLLAVYLSRLDTEARNKVNIINLRASAIEFKHFFEASGFVNEFDQYEMTYDLTADK